MPITRSHRSPSAPALTSRSSSAAETVYSILEIRREIIRHLSFPSLAAFIRAEKACTEDVAKELYRSYRCSVIDVLMSKDPMRQQIYSSAVVQLEARAMDIGPAVRTRLGWEELDGHYAPDEYHPLAFNFVVPYLRHRYPSMRTLRFTKSEPFETYGGGPPGSYTVKFDPAVHAGIPPGSVPSYDKHGYIGELGGDIDILADQYASVQNFDGDTPRKQIRHPVVPPKGSYTIKCRFNMRLNNIEGDASEADIESWKLALKGIKGGRGFENLHTHVEFEEVPIKLGYLTILYQRQIAAGHSTRLQHIDASGLKGWHIGNFAAFASVASSSLTSLSLLGMRKTAWPTTSLEFLQQLVSIVRTDLPNLSKLALGFWDRGRAEVACKGFVVPGVLDAVGPVSDLQFVLGYWRSEARRREDQTVEYGTPLFNLIRVLSGMCTPTAEIGITRFVARKDADQTAYLQYLHRQPKHCKAQLAVADFAAMGLTNLREVLKLDYHPDGRPFKAVEPPQITAEKANTLDWVERLEYTKTAKEGITGGVVACRTAIARLDEVSATAPNWEKLTLAEQLLGVLRPLKEEVDRLSRSLDLEGVEGYVRALKAQTGQGSGNGAGE